MGFLFHAFKTDKFIFRYSRRGACQWLCGRRSEQRQPDCKASNRSSGLRYRANDVARSIVSTGRVPGAKPQIELIEAGSSDAARARC
jgi:hypothetical protein